MRAAARQENHSDSEGIYESFSDMVLCTVIVLITLVVVLALNVVEQLSVYIEPNHFSGGATRPWLYLQAQNADYSKSTSDQRALERTLYGNAPFVMLNLYSPSAALSPTTIRDGEVIAAHTGESFLGQCDLSAYSFLQLAAGIEPGTFPVAGKPSALLLPKFSHKHVVLDARNADAPKLQPDNALALHTMAAAWPVYANALHPRRAAADYQEARTRIYLEALETAGGRHRIMIGHTIFELPLDVENGRLGWLAGFASGLTEVVYLGKAWADPVLQTNKRIAFFENNGFPEAAADYRAFSYPGPLTSGQEKLLQKVMAVRPDLPRNQLVQYVRQADAQRSVSDAILHGTSIRPFLPPLLKHREAWKAYTESCTKAAAENPPPEWLMSELLKPLGFDQAVVRGLRNDA